MGYKLGTVIRGYVEGDAVFHKYMGDEGISNVDGSSIVSSRNEYSFFQQVVYDHEDGCETAENTLGDEVLAVGVNVGPCVVSTEQGEHFVEAEVSGCEVVVLGLQDSSVQVALLGSVVRDIHVMV